MPRPDTLDALADLAEDQWGLFTRRQAEATGMAWTTLSRLARNGPAERVAHGVYRLRGVPPIDHLPLRAAWLQLAPDTVVWERGAESGVVSHRSAAAVYNLGHLPADVHEFTLPVRRQSRRRDVRVHRAELGEDEWIRLRGLPVTRPARIAADLLSEGEDPEAVGQIIADALRSVREYPTDVATAIAPLATRFGLRRNDGVGLLRWLLDLSADTNREQWLAEAESALRSTRPSRGDGSKARGQ